MAFGLILEFDGIGREVYDAVNRNLGIDTTRPSGDWPPGLIFHAGGAKPGGWAIFEVWAAKQDQERFMNNRLGRALQLGGVTSAPSRVEWLDLAAHTTPATQ
jgi:hypothetical protein